MLSGTDLNYAFSFALDDVNTGADHTGSKYSGYGTHGDSPSSHANSSKRSLVSPSSSSRDSMAPSPSKQVRSKVDADDIAPSPPKMAPPPQASNYDTIFTHTSPEQKIQMLSQELYRQRELMEHHRLSNVGYFDKLMARRKELLKFLLFSLIILLALSIHTQIKHYYKAFFQSHVLTPGKEFGIRMVYPLVVIFILWNLRVFVR